MRHTPQGTRGIDVIGTFDPVADIDERQGIEDPSGQMRNGQAIDVIAPMAALLDQTMGPQQTEVLGHPRGRQLQRSGQAIHVALGLMQFLDQPQSVCVGQKPHQICKFARNDAATWQRPLPGSLQTYADLQLWS